MSVGAITKVVNTDIRTWSTPYSGGTYTYAHATGKSKAAGSHERAQRIVQAIQALASRRRRNDRRPDSRRCTHGYRDGRSSTRTDRRTRRTRRTKPVASPTRPTQEDQQTADVVLALSCVLATRVTNEGVRVLFIPVWAIGQNACIWRLLRP